MGEILEAETDTALFKALRYQQGVAISQAAIGGSPTLVVALDAAAGGTGRVGGAGADALFARVEAERQRYFTATGRLTVERARKIEQLAVLRTGVSDVERRLLELDQAVERHRQIQSDFVELQTQSLSVADQIDESLKAVQGVEEVERRVETARYENELRQDLARLRPEVPKSRHRNEGARSLPLPLDRGLLQQPPPALNTRTAKPAKIRRDDDRTRPTDGGRRLKPKCQRERGNSTDALGSLDEWTEKRHKIVHRGELVRMRRDEAGDVIKLIRSVGKTLNDRVIALHF